MSNDPYAYLHANIVTIKSTIEHEVANLCTHTTILDNLLRKLIKNNAFEQCIRTIGPVCGHVNTIKTKLERQEYTKCAPMWSSFFMHLQFYKATLDNVQADLELVKHYYAILNRNLDDNTKNKRQLDQEQDQDEDFAKKPRI